jgi:hypothetical protein
MPITVNIPSQIVVQTAAQWAGDATVYGEKRILVTSDVFYGATDQRQFKIADGVQTWVNLDYMPIGGGGENLAATLAIGNATGQQDIISDNTKAVLRAENSEASVIYNDGAGNGQVKVTKFETTIDHDIENVLDAPNNRFPQETALGIAAFDASSNLKALPVATYPSLTELATVKGVTSSIQTQITANKKASFGISLIGGGAVITTGYKGHITIPFTGTITGWNILSTLTGSIVVDTWKQVYGSYPPTVADTIWGGSKPTLSSQDKNQATGLSIAVTAGDIVAFNVDSATTVQLVQLDIFITKS